MTQHVIWMEFKTSSDPFHVLQISYGEMWQFSKKKFHKYHEIAVSRIFFCILLPCFGRFHGYLWGKQFVNMALITNKKIMKLQFHEKFREHAQLRFFSSNFLVRMKIIPKMLFQATSSLFESRTSIKPDFGILVQSLAEEIQLLLVENRHHANGTMCQILKEQSNTI